MPTPQKFQSSPSPKAGSYADASHCCKYGSVSILSQPEGRELHNTSNGLSRIFSFNPLPARRPGATFFSEISWPLIWFQSSPSPKAGSYVASAVTIEPGEKVSILSQPEGRELPCAGLAIEVVRCFNPLPARRPGATLLHLSDANSDAVSILSQPEGRELRGVGG